MQNRYTGDIGDFSKLGVLRVLQAVGLSIGVNWYLTPDETHNTDGCHVKYLEQDKFRACDEGLWLCLKEIVESGEREVRRLEDDRILKATFFSEYLDFRGKTKRKRVECRDGWYRRSLSALAGKDVVCVDPDNGLIVPSATGGPKENKYVLREELAGYFAQGSSVIYYQHKARRKDPFYVQLHDGLVHSQGFPGAEGLALKFKTTSQRLRQPNMTRRRMLVHDGRVESRSDFSGSAWESFRSPPASDWEISRRLAASDSLLRASDASWARSSRYLDSRSVTLIRAADITMNWLYCAERDRHSYPFAMRSVESTTVLYHHP